MICWENSLIDDFVSILINDSSKVKYTMLSDSLIPWSFMGGFFMGDTVLFLCSHFKHVDIKMHESCMIITLDLISR